MRIAASPAMTMKIDSTAAKIGRSIKKRENIGDSFRILVFALYFFASAFFTSPLPALRPAFAFHSGRRAKHDRCATGDREQLGGAVGDDDIARLQTRLDDPLLLAVDFDPIAQRHWARQRDVGLAVLTFTGNEDELALRPIHHRALRHDDRVRTHRAFDDHAHKLSWPQCCIRDSVAQHAPRTRRWPC